MRKEKIESAFKKAGLPINVLTERPEGTQVGARLIDVDSDAVFQMGVQSRPTGRTKKPVEWFQMYLGAKENDVRVLDVDKKKQQVLLFVKEPAHKFEQTTTQLDRRGHRRAQTRSQTTDDSVRKYLMGMDERHLFISQIRESTRVVNKVAEAHTDLRPMELNRAQRAGKVRRQGEYFFIEVDFDPSKQIWGGDRTLRLRDEPIGRGTSLGMRSVGTPHVAENLVVLGPGKMYVKGKIRHAEHSTINLLTWHQVFMNNELVQAGRMFRPVDYVD